MWVARFKLKDDEDIYSPLCIKHKIDFFASPYTTFEKGGKIHLLVGSILVGSEDGKRNYVETLRNDKRVISVDVSKDFILVHAAHPISREARKEIKIAYNPQYLRIKPVHVAKDGWEYWELACFDREELNKFIQVAKKHYHGKLLSIKQEKISHVSSLAISPDLSEKQLATLQAALKEGYYDYPRKITLPELAKISKVAYSTFQEHLSKAEAKIISYFFNYR